MHNSLAKKFCNYCAFVGCGELFYVNECFEKITQLITFDTGSNCLVLKNLD